MVKYELIPFQTETGDYMDSQPNKATSRSALTVVCNFQWGHSSEMIKFLAGILNRYSKYRKVKKAES